MCQRQDSSLFRNRKVTDIQVLNSPATSGPSFRMKVEMCCKAYICRLIVLHNELHHSPARDFGTIKSTNIVNYPLWFAAYHERFGHEETDSNCVCGQKRAQLHPFSCAHARKHRLHLWCNKRQRQLAPDEVLGTPEGVTAFAKWAPATGLFRRHCRMREEDGVEEWNKDTLV